MLEYLASTDKVEKIKLPSAIQRILWTKHCAVVGTKIGLEIFTEFVGNNSEIQIELCDKTSKKFDTIKAKISGNYFWKEITVPVKAKDELYASVKLPKHNLHKKSNCLSVYPPVQIKNCKWDKKEARRGDILKITADVLNAYEGTEAEVQILEYDADGAHDFITKIPAIVKNKKIEIEWEYKYFEDTDDIPTAEETEKGYNPPEYFFRIIVAGISAESPLLQFKDWIEIELTDDSGKPVSGGKYKLIFPDGTERNGTLDNKGYAHLDNIPPGPFNVEFPDLNEALISESPEE